MTGDVIWSCTAITLTPIHVGDGSSLTPDDWRLLDGQLERFASSAVLRDLGPASRQRYLAELDQGRLLEAQRLLRGGVRPGHVLERIAVTAESAAELGQVIENPLRRGEVRPFIRSAGRPFLPGSSIKGAIRTAVLSELVQTGGDELARELVTMAREPTGRRNDRLQQQLLDADNPDRDPLRFVQVADAALPEGATRIDKIENWKPGPLRGSRHADSGRGIQMHFERLASSADGRAARFELRLAVRFGRLAAARARDAAGSRTPRRELPPAELWRMINDFHWRRFDAERDRFFSGEPATLRLLSDKLRLKRGDRIDDEEAFRRGYPYLLLRIGRFGQFESKSVDGYREGWNAQARRPMTEGSTRNIVRIRRAMSDGQREEVITPMGWLLLVATSQTWA